MKLGNIVEIIMSYQGGERTLVTEDSSFCVILYCFSCVILFFELQQCQYQKRFSCFLNIVILIIHMLKSIHFLNFNNVNKGVMVKPCILVVATVERFALCKDNLCPLYLGEVNAILDKSRPLNGLRKSLFHFGF